MSLSHATPSSSHAISMRLLENPNAEKQTSNSRERFFIPAVFLIYAIGDGSWQLIDDLLGNDHFNFYARTAIDGAAQACGASLTNALMAYLDITRHWGRWEIGGSLVTGTLWLPFVKLGEYFCDRAEEKDPTSANAILLVANTILICNLATLYVSQGIQKCFAPRAITQENNEPSAKKMPSNVADSLAASAFYIQGTTHQPGSTTGKRNVGWASLFSAAGAVVGEGLSYAFRRCRTRPRDEEPPSDSLLGSPPVISSPSKP